MKLTSAEANKLIKKLEDNKLNVETEERNLCTFNAATIENESELKPHYIFSETQGVIDRIDASIRKLKHAINVFNCTTEVVDGLTIDQVLILLPQLARKKSKLDVMRKKPSKDRYQITGNIIDYTYTSYDPEEAQDEYAKTVDQISKLQLSLDKINTNVEFDIDIEL